MPIICQWIDCDLTSAPQTATTSARMNHAARLERLGYLTSIADIHMAALSCLRKRESCSVADRSDEIELTVKLLKLSAQASALLAAAMIGVESSDQAAYSRLLKVQLGE